MVGLTRVRVQSSEFRVFSVQGLSVRQLQAVVGEIAPALVGGRLQNIHQVERDLILTFRVPGETLYLLFSVAPGLARTHLVKERPRAPAQPPAFCGLLRSRLKGCRLSDLRQVPNDRIVELTFVMVQREHDTSSQESEANVGFLVHELFGRRANLILLDGERNCVAQLNAAVREGRRLSQNTVYKFPPPSGGSSKEGGPVDLDLPAGEGPFPISGAIEEYFSRAHEGLLFVERRAAISRTLGRELKRRRATLAKAEKDLERAQERERDREFGELLKGAYGQLKRGLATIELTDYFSEDLGNRIIELEPFLSPQENIERYFKRYRKAQRAIPILRQRLGTLRNELHALEELEARAQAATQLADLEGLETAASRFAGRKRQATRSVHRKGEAHGPRRFVSSDGYEILVGRTATENDRLTFRIARGNDLFFHVAGRPGAHVILRTQPGAEVPVESLRDAALLALYYSLPVRSGGVLVEGARADVDYTPVKHVRKPRGGKPGLVLLATHRTIRTELDNERLTRLRQPQRF